MTTTPGDLTRFATLDQEADPGFFVRFVDELNAAPSIRKLKERIAEELHLRPGHRVLDVGCGTGDDVRRLAKEVGPGGFVTGIDASEVMIAEARRRAEGCGLPVEFRVGNAANLEFANAAFDAVRTERVLLHVPEAAGALAEMVRVTRPGGRIAVCDIDTDAIVIDHPDEALVRRFVSLLGDGLANGRIGRRLPRLLREAGLDAVQATSYAASDLPYEFLVQAFEGVLAGAAAGGFEAVERERFWAGLEEAEKAGGVFFSFTAVIASGMKP